MANDVDVIDLKRKFKDVLRAYWRQHKSHHEGEDTEQYDVAQHIASSIFALYWDKPIYEPLRKDKTEIMNYFIKHIQLSKTREGQSNNLHLKTASSLPGRIGDRKINDVEKAVQGIQAMASGNNNDLQPIKYLKEELDLASSKWYLKNEAHSKSVEPYSINGINLGSKSGVCSPQPSEPLKAWIKTNLPKSQLYYTLLVEGIPSCFPEKTIRLELIKALQTQYGVEVTEILSVPYSSKKNIYKLLLPSTEECVQLDSQLVKIKSVSHYLMLMYPATILNKLETSRPRRSNRKRKFPDEENGIAKKRCYDASKEDFDSSDENVQADGGILTPAAPFFNAKESHLIETDSFVADRILRQRWVNNKIQYQLRLRGEKQTIKLWIFDEDIYSEFESNRRNAAMMRFQQGNYQNLNVNNSVSLPEIQEILGVKMVKEQLMFYVKWKKSEIYTFVPSPIVHKIAPQQVIQFYESRLSFKDSPNNTSSNTPSSAIYQVNSSTSQNESNSGDPNAQPETSNKLESPNKNTTDDLLSITDINKSLELALDGDHASFLQ
ncbi:uncharacterized protein LOC126304682 [Schistocerca gregaria]|uniref:uncharacterized protein LOC126304682 n=1 Tax=Schistocerca gregaria TaxID=7010 RepID=UPI00211DC7FE|nr:uncharacterized protein LOC126304682 [Schistocerca gregaria]